MERKNNIFIPKDLKVGFQQRSNTYNGKLAYVIYKDEKGVLRKEKSWKSWIDKDIEPMELTNEPLEGFVIHEKVGGYASGWNYRQTYVRVYDPRGFEFEITVPNLLYILEHCNIYKGKGIEGKLAYAWCDKELILLPVLSPIYKQSEKFSLNKLENKKIGIRDMVQGYTYRTKQNEEWIFIDRNKKGFFFFNIRLQQFKKISSVTNKFIDFKEEVHPSFNKLYELIQHLDIYSDVVPEATQYIEFDFKENVSRTYYDMCILSEQLKPLILSNGELTQQLTKGKLHYIKNQITDNKYIECTIWARCFADKTACISFSIRVDCSTVWGRHTESIELYCKEAEELEEVNKDFFNYLEKMGLTIYRKVYYLENGAKKIEGYGDEFYEILKTII